MGASAAKMTNNNTKKKRYARASCWVGFLELLASGFVEKIGVWEQLILRQKRRYRQKLQKFNHGHT